MAKIMEREGRTGWYSDFTVSGKRVQRFLSNDKREAQIELGRLLADMKGEAKGIPNRDISWPAWRAKYLTIRRGSAAAETVKRDESSFISLEAHFTINSLRQITLEMLESWKSKRLAAGIGKPTVNRELKSVKTMLDSAATFGYIDKMELSKVKLMPERRKKLRFHSVEELGRLLSRCHGVWTTIVLLGARAGLRRGEIHGLRWDSVQFDRNRLQVTGDTKTEGSLRFVPLAADLRQHLLAIRGEAKGPFVIGGEHGERPSMDVMSAYCQKLHRKAKLRGSLHILRHTFASHLMMAGVDIISVRDLLGHTDVKMTQIYAEVSPAHMEENSVSRLPEIMVTGFSGNVTGVCGHEGFSGPVGSGVPPTRNGILVDSQRGEAAPQ